MLNPKLKTAVVILGASTGVGKAFLMIGRGEP